MDETTDPLEALWDRLLSRRKEQVRAAFDQLEDSQKRHVLAHLQRMADEPGWHPQQRESAREALKALETDGYS